MLPWPWSSTRYSSSWRPRHCLRRTCGYPPACPPYGSAAPDDTSWWHPGSWSWFCRAPPAPPASSPAVSHAASGWSGPPCPPSACRSVRRSAWRVRTVIWWHAAGDCHSCSVSRSGPGLSAVFTIALGRCWTACSTSWRARSGTPTHGCSIFSGWPDDAVGMLGAGLDFDYAFFMGWLDGLWVVKYNIKYAQLMHGWDGDNIFQNGRKESDKL